MGRNIHKPEEIVGKPRQVDVLTAQGTPLRRRCRRSWSGTWVTCGALAHGRHGRLDVARLKLGEGVGVEHLAECACDLRRHRFRSRFTFASITSQIIAAMSFPPNCAICLMPVGEVTLISVR